LPVQKSDKESKEGAMTEHIPTPLDTRRLVAKPEELRRKREGTWDRITMVSETSPDGAALRARRASPDKVTDVQPIAIELLKNETPPKFKAACAFTTEKPQGDGEDHAGLVEVPAGDHSPPHEPTSLPTPVTTVENGTTKAELLPPGKAATREAEKPKTETTPPAAMGRKGGRNDGCQLKKQKLLAGTSKAGPKFSPDLMLIVINSLTQVPMLWHAASEAGIHRKTLAYWLDRSEAGYDGYDIEWEGLTLRFHELCEFAIDEAHQTLDDLLLERAFFGYDKVLTYRGRVMYKIDQGLAGLGCQGADAFLKDENGNPIPETVRKVDRKALRYIWERSRTWGKYSKIDAPREGGVLVIGERTKKPKYNTAASVRARKWKAASRRIREE
jgi:hypothetical protein